MHIYCYLITASLARHSQISHEQASISPFLALQSGSEQHQTGCLTGAPTSKDTRINNQNHNNHHRTFHGRQIDFDHINMPGEPLNKLCAAALRPEFSIAALQNLAIVRAIPGVLRLALKNSGSQISSPKLVQRFPGYAFEIVIEEEWEDVFVDAT
jgi:hypothetical protein